MLTVSIKKRLGGAGTREGGNGRAGSGEERVFLLDVEFTAPEGVTILFGPSGSGKTTCLRAIAGIVTPDAGRIALGERVFFDSASGVNLPIQQRRVGLLFQDYALFPHLTAEQNIAFGVRADAGGGKRDRPRELLNLLGIEYTARQYPRELSGGEAQRVALARALASDPAAMLLDEPLSAVDVKTRERLVAEIRDIQQKTGIPFLYVTHNTAEAAAVGSEIIVLQEGRVAYQGPTVQARLPDVT
ncbi:MAG: Spermidine/putrescine import ATP-binding protein PotA [Acidobacteria bacterium]|nr:Spermidine/putrescine import ATP-binding protein PotA [Acidobacteriota bacterium]